MTKPIRVGMVAGEASGDLLGAKMMESLRASHPDIQFEGVGGPKMIALGFNSLFDMERLSVMGFVEPLLHLPDLLRLRRDILKHFTQQPPDVFIGIDAPDFNLGLEITLRQQGIRIVHYVSPSVWAWRQYRIHKIAKAVDLMLTLLPFEAAFYEKHGIPVKYVGHPLADQIPLYPDKVATRLALGLDEKATYVALLPGSRRQELKHMAETFIQAAQLALRSKPNLQFITSQINEKRYHEFTEILKRVAPGLPITIYTKRSHEVMAAADAIVVTSGTATLEAMLYKKPMIIAYKMSKPTYWLAKWLVKTPYIGLPNLLANKLLVPELIQDQATPAAIAAHLVDYLDNPEKAAQLEAEFVQLHQLLESPSSSSLSESILNLM